MLEIILLRHGKSNWDAPYSHDRERPLSKRGVRSARAIGRALTLVHRAPDLVLTSPAERAAETSRLAAAAGAWSAPIHEVEALYAGGPEAVLVTARAVPTGVQRLMLVGHEPGWSEAASMLVGGGEIRLATATAAAIESAVESWGELAPGTGRLVWMLNPRLFTDGDLRLE